MMPIVRMARYWLALAVLAGAANSTGVDFLRDDPAAAAAARHWAFRPPVRPPLPAALASAERTPHPVDAFIASKQAELGITPLPEAGRRTLIRRLALDLTGLPPTPEAVDRFLSDASPDAYARLVERLLASPHYGERWGRFWLDLARWAESDGFEANALRSSAWRYRDYVVTAFNADKPYDQFLREQIAGDELTPYSDENIIATGFLAAGCSNNNEEDKTVQLNGPRVDMANSVASVTLGLTLNCAQCHDHKFEPITARDYYAFHGFFVRGQINNLVLRDPELLGEWEKSKPPELATARTLLEQLMAPVRARLQHQTQTASGESKVTDTQIRDALSADDRTLFDALKKKIRMLEQDLLNRKPHTWGYFSPATSPHALESLPQRGQYPFPYQPAVLKTNQAFVFLRGDAHHPDAPVSPGLPTALDRNATNFASRAQLVDWLVSGANPLTARVWVNFVWQQHFGQGLVESSGDFGLKGAPPANLELLDWLACELQQSTLAVAGEPNFSHRWSTKHLHRLLVTSAAYRRAHRHDPGSARSDPANRHLWHWEPRRLESEALRDAMLAVSGSLDKTIGGPSEGQASGPTSRRSLYLRQQRNVLPAMQALFDAPTANESCPRRHVSTIALQPLHFLNNADVYRWASGFAARVLREAGDDSHRQIERACALALSRPPDDAEREWAMKFLARPTADDSTHSSSTKSRTISAPAADGTGNPPLALVHFCHALFNLNEFAYIE